MSARATAEPSQARAEAGKSGARNFLLEQYFSASTCTGRVFDECQAQATVCAIDVMQCLKACNAERNTPTWRSFQHAMTNDARHTSRFFPKVHTFVLCFDRYARVALAKAVEQQARSKTAEGRSALVDFEIGGLDDIIGEGFSAAIHDRTVWIPRLIAWLCKQWCTTCPPNFLEREGQRLVVDGHGLGYDDLPGVAVHPDAPLVIARRNGALEVDFLDDLAHQHGEGDLSMIYLLQRLAENNATVMVYSVDSDLTWYLLRFLEKSDKHFEIFLRYRPGLSWCASAKPNPDIRYAKNPQTWIHVNRLKTEIQSHLPLRKLPLEHRVPTLTVLAACAGNDFVDKVSYVPVHHFLRAYFNNQEFIGALVQGDAQEIHLDAEGFARLTACAVAQSHTTADYVEGKTKKNAKKPSPRMPTDTGLGYRALHMELCLRIMNSIGEPAFDEPLLCQFGYGRANRALPPSRTNLCRLHNDDEPDEWDFQGHLLPLAQRGRTREQLD